MTQKRITPGWGKAVGIIMIVLGGLGVFYQFYKILAPKILETQSKVMDTMSHLPSNDGFSGNRAVSSMFNEFLQMSSFQTNVFVFSGIIGFLLCAFYIVAGAKLLVAKPINYKLAQYALISFLVLNLGTIFLLFRDAMSLFVIGLMVYIIIGFVFDLVLLIILLASDKRRYGIGGEALSEINTLYNQDEVL